MEDRITALEERHKEMVDAVIEINTNLASIGLSTTESIKAIMEGFQSVNIAMHEIIQNFTALETRIADIEKEMKKFPSNEN